jgi:predicted nuclease with TOPRIM domain
MASDYDATEFVDGDFQTHKSPNATATGGLGHLQRAPTREEVDSKVIEAQQKLAELKRAQEDLERERSALEETRRRQMEFQTGREEMVQNLTRGLGLLEESEFNARREAEQMAKAMADLREALGKVQAVQEQNWTKDGFNVELTRALTSLENARMEWNAARLKFPVLSGEALAAGVGTPGSSVVAPGWPGSQSFAQLCRLGLALTWPVAIVALAGLGLLLALFFRR